MIDKLSKIEEYAKLNNVPIMEKEGIDFLVTYIKENNIKSILEIGSAIGYSAIKMALVSDDITITTIERDINRYDQAINNINEFGLNKRIDIILDDAFNVKIEKKYDLIFIDAAKSQYIKFFEKFKINLNENGVIVTDNLKFHGLAINPELIKGRSLRALVRKLNDYVDFLKTNEEFSTTFYDIGDGVAISTRNK
jgi:predicted O-methyltransferase YrrM